MEIQALTHEIKRWAVDRGLHQGEPLEQYDKLVEELGEVAGGIAKSDKFLIQDGIGDMYVVMTILLMRNDERIEDVNLVKVQRDMSGWRPSSQDNLITVELMDNVTNLGKSLIYTNMQVMKVEEIIRVLYKLANINGLNFVECVGMAYDEIKHRKGETINGRFIKDEDLKKMAVQNQDDFL